MNESRRSGYGWLSGTLVTAFVLLLAWQGGLRDLDRKVYDWGVRSAKPLPSSEVVLIEVDQRSLDQQGAWPWPRNHYAELLDLIKEAGPSVIGLALDLSRPETNPAQAVVAELLEGTGEGPLAGAVEAIDALDERLAEMAARRSEAVEGPVETVGVEGVRESLAVGLRTLTGRLREAGEALDGDRRLIDSLSDAPRPILPFHFVESNARGGVGTLVSPPSEFPAYAARSLLGMVDQAYRPLAGKRLVLPIESIGAQSSGIGYLQACPDSDQVLRATPLLVQVQARLLPSMALALVAAHRGLALPELQLDAYGLQLGEWRRAVSPDLRMQVAFYSGDSLQRFSATDILEERVVLGPLRDKIVLIGPTAEGAAIQRRTPRGEWVSPVELVSHSVANLLQGEGFLRPAWGDWAEWGGLALAGLFLILLLPRLAGLVAVVVTLLLAGLLIGAEYGLLVETSLWLSLTPAAVLLLAGLLALLTVRGLSAERARPAARAASTHSDETVERPPVPVPTAVPEAFGRYRVERSLGKMGCGARYLCRDTREKREVVLRTFELGLTERQLANIKQRFMAELGQAKALEHPTILPPLDAGEAQRRLFLVSEHVEGWDLRRIAQPNRLLKVPQALEIAAKCAEALAYAHDRNLVHGEVCPLNIQYLVQDKRIKLSGFGTSILTASVHAQSERLLPTSFYLSPEYLTGDLVDRRADLFALGVTLYQLLSGQLPFRADTVATLTYRIVNEDPPPIQPLRPEVPDCAVAILDRCLAKAAPDRYQDGTSLARDLRLCAQHTLREAAAG